MSNLKINIELPDKLLPLFDPKRYKVAYGGRGSGKSWSVARALIALASSKKIFVLCARETQTSIEQSVHKLLKEQIELMGLSSFYTVQERKIIGANGSAFVFAGIRQQGIDNLKSFEGADICWVEEAHVVTKRSWNTLLPTIRKPGSEVWITFNPELETDEVYARFVKSKSTESWVKEINYTDNPWFTRELEIERLECLRIAPDDYATVWEGKCRPAVQGAIYAKEIAALQDSGRVRPVPVDPILPVHTVWDLGWNDSMSIICFQVLSSEVRIVKYIEDSHRTLADYVADLETLKWRWGTDYLPHDGAAKDFKTGKSAQEIAQSMGRTVQVIQRMSIEEGIRATRLMFPRVYVDDGSIDLVNALKRYRRGVNQRTNEPGAPVHDSASHGADAFRGLAVIIDSVSNAGEVRMPRRRDSRGNNWRTA